MSFEDKLAKHRVRPCEPRTRISIRVVLVEGLVHETSAGVCSPQCVEAMIKLSVVRAGDALQRESERPDHALTRMRPAGTTSGLALAKIGVAFGQNKTACIKINFVVRLHSLKIWQREQAGDIAVVNTVVVSKAVYFVSVD